MIKQISRGTQKSLGTMLPAAIVLGLLIGCGAGTSGQNLAEQEQLNRRLGELERRLEMQSSRQEQLASQFKNAGGLAQTGSRYSAMDHLDTLLLEEIHFDLNQFSLDEYDREILDMTAKRMAEKPASFLEITGYTDRSGNEFYNYLLSRQRADAALRYLIDKYDIPQNRMDAQGFGPEVQKYPNDVGDGANKNRRIEVLLRQIAQQSEPMP